MKISRDVHNFGLWKLRKKLSAKIMWSWCICIFSVVLKCSWEQKRNILKCSVRTEQYRTFFWCGTFCSDRTFESDVPSYPVLFFIYSVIKMCQKLSKNLSKNLSKYLPKNLLKNLTKKGIKKSVQIYEFAKISQIILF